MEMSSDFAAGLAGFSFNADIEEIKDSFNRVNEAFVKKNKTPRLVTSFWFGLGEGARSDIQIHLERYLGWMGEDLAKDLAKTAGFSGSQDELVDFLHLIKAAGATDVIMVPTSKNIEQLILAEEAIAEFKQNLTN
jgi:hypothetical protein